MVWGVEWRGGEGKGCLANSKPVNPLQIQLKDKPFFSSILRLNIETGGVGGGGGGGSQSGV